MGTVKHVLDKKFDELGQYGRRVCLRIESVEHQANEKSEEVLEKVANIRKKSETEIPESVLEKAHGTGPTYTDSNMVKKMQSITARFTTFRRRTLLYANRKNVKSDA